MLVRKIITLTICGLMMTAAIGCDSQPITEPGPKKKMENPSDPNSKGAAEETVE